jgi:hypothetical protein
MGCTFHCWVIPEEPGAQPHEQAGHFCCFCGGIEEEKDEKVTWAVEVTRSRAEIRHLAVEDCSLCLGSGMIGEHKQTVCRCVDPFRLI